MIQQVDYGFTKPYSEETAKVIDEEVMRIVNEQYERAKSILHQYAKEHNAIRDLLVEREVIFHDDVQTILGPRKWKSRTDEIIEINKKEEEKRQIGQKYGKNTDSTHDDENLNEDGDDMTPPPFTKG